MITDIFQPLSATSLSHGVSLDTSNHLSVVPILNDHPEDIVSYFFSDPVNCVRYGMDVHLDSDIVLTHKGTVITDIYPTIRHEFEAGLNKAVGGDVRTVNSNVLANLYSIMDIIRNNDLSLEIDRPLKTMINRYRTGLPKGVPLSFNLMPITDDAAYKAAKGEADRKIKQGHSNVLPVVKGDFQLPMLQSKIYWISQITQLLSAVSLMRDGIKKVMPAHLFVSIVISSVRFSVFPDYTRLGGNPSPGIEAPCIGMIQNNCLSVGILEHVLMTYDDDELMDILSELNEVYSLRNGIMPYPPSLYTANETLDILLSYVERVNDPFIKLFPNF